MLPAFKACLLSTFLQVLARTAESWARRASENWANHKIVVFTPRQGQSTTDHICGAEAGHECSLRSGAAVPECDAVSRRSNRGTCKAIAQAGSDAGLRHDRSTAAIAFLQVQVGEDAESSASDCGSDHGDDTGMGVTVEVVKALQHRDWLLDCDDSDTDDSSTETGGAGVGPGGQAAHGSQAPDCQWVAGPDDAVALQLLEYTRSEAAAAAVACAREPEGAAGDMDAVLESLAGRGAAAEEMEAWARSQSP